MQDIEANHYSPADKVAQITLAQCVSVTTSEGYVKDIFDICSFVSKRPKHASSTRGEWYLIIIMCLTIRNPRSLEEVFQIKILESFLLLVHSMDQKFRLFCDNDFITVILLELFKRMAVQIKIKVFLWYFVVHTTCKLFNTSIDWDMIL